MVALISIFQAHIFIYFAHIYKSNKCCKNGNSVFFFEITKYCMLDLLPRLWCGHISKSPISAGLEWENDCKESFSISSDIFNSVPL